MALLLNDEQKMLQESARDFLSARAPVSHLRSLRDSGNETGHDPAIWKEMADMGWPASVIPEVHGGLGFGYTGLGVVLQETGRTLTPAPLLSSSLIAATVLLQAGSKQQKEALLGNLASGERCLTLACDERTRHQPARVEVSASADGSEYVLNGRKRYVLDGMLADTLLVSARTRGESADTDGISLFLVPVDSAGVSRQRCAALDTDVLADIRLEQVRVPAEALVGELHQAWPVLSAALDAGRIGQSAELLGLAEEALQRTVQYLKERKQFGVLIGSFQALQHRAAVLYSEVEMCKSLVLHALQQLDAGTDSLAELASMTKAKVSETAMNVTAEAIQMHGGIGMTDEFEIGFFYKRARVLETLLGDRYFHLDRYARRRGY